MKRTWIFVDNRIYSLIGRAEVHQSSFGWVLVLPFKVDGLYKDRDAAMREAEKYVRSLPEIDANSIDWLFKESK